jgi:hypothetical protein
MSGPDATGMMATGAGGTVGSAGAAGGGHGGAAGGGRGGVAGEEAEDHTIGTADMMESLPGSSVASLAMCAGFWQVCHVSLPCL